MESIKYCWTGPPEVRLRIYSQIGYKGAWDLYQSVLFQRMVIGQGLREDENDEPPQE